MQFAVRVKGLDEPDGETCRWVIATDPTAGLLVANDDGTLAWHPLEDCTFAKGVLPDAPMPVIPVQMQDAPGTLALPNRAMRREIKRNGA